MSDKDKVMKLSKQDKIDIEIVKKSRANRLKMKPTQEALLKTFSPYISDTRFDMDDNSSVDKVLVIHMHTPDIESVINFEFNSMPSLQLSALDEDVVVHVVYDLGIRKLNTLTGQQLDINTDMRLDGSIDMEQYTLDYVVDSNGKKQFTGSQYNKIKKTFKNNDAFATYLGYL